MTALHQQALQVKPRPYAIIKRISQIQISMENLMEQVEEVDFDFKLRSELLALSNTRRALEGFSQNLHKIDPILTSLPVPLTVKIESSMWKQEGPMSQKPSKDLIEGCHLCL